MSVIALDQVSKKFDTKFVQVTALDDVSLIIEPGEMIAIMGPSGSGKSTLMNVIGLLDRPTKGNLTIDNAAITLDMSDKKLASLRSTKIGFVFQSFNLLPRLSAIQNVMLPMQYTPIHKPQSKKHAAELLAQVGLEKRVDHLPSQLSGGEKQRVAIARALVNDPNIILADEPTGNLDSKSGEDVMQIIKQLNQKGKTVIIVTHDQHVADQCQRIVRLLDGKVVSS